MVVRKQRLAARSAFTLMEVLVAVAIVLILAGSGAFLYLNHLENAKKDIGKANVDTLDQQVQIYYTRHHQFPPDLATLTQLGPNGEAAAIETRALIDPWDRPYHYEPQNLHPLTRKPHVYSEGPTPGTPGSRISNWENNQ
jgi:prepilin-type N-terminal cleavage/methylation domain-containing protein